MVPVPVGGGANNGNCCRTVTVKSSVAAVPQQKDSISRPAILRINYYRAYLMPSNKKNKRYDTTVQLIKHKDTLVHFKDRLVIPARMDSASQYKVYNICRDSLVQMQFPLVGDLTKETDSTHPVHYTLSDTVYQKEEPVVVDEVIINGRFLLKPENRGIAFRDSMIPFSIRRLMDHQITATLEISRILARWFQLGLSASYVVLSYQDDIGYPGYCAGNLQYRMARETDHTDSAFRKIQFRKTGGLSVEHQPVFRIFHPDQWKN